MDFVEWMMGFDAGWVDGLTRTAALRCLGNAVVPQQGAYALAQLLPVSKAVSDTATTSLADRAASDAIGADTPG